ncbi:glycosyltransferase family 2 protein [Ruminococcus sp.]|jgi:rhamnosyltransferase|uniref:glycosyltransferase family 2 protein n=1 Tax=Ruminococcus sp. TaxID=41978 RepID=UPI0025ED7709|nr:glycosyltransferase family 2 protein [Ruminococcus sp.]
MDKIIVLMSAYKGKKYINDQLNSILNQKKVDVEILIRVDGSPDDTYQYIQEIASKQPKIKVYEGENLRSAKSFLNLVQCAPENEYYAFSDQDDIWDEDKLYVALKHIKGYPADKPNMYYSNLRVVDSNLKTIRSFHSSSFEGENKYNILIDNMAAGCTMVFNRKAAELAVRKIPEYCLMHDAWIHLVCAFFGNVYYDKRPHISYRQHEDNVVGASKLDFDTVKDKFTRLFDNSVQPRKMLSKEFLNCYRDMLSEKEKRELSKLANYQRSIKDKMSLLFDKTIKAPNSRRNIVYKFLILLNKA